MSKLLLYSWFFVAISGSFCTATASETAVAPDRSEMKITFETAENPYSFDRMQVENSTVGDDFCLNIHAFIFKTNDDRVPKLVGETTCMPASRARAKKADKITQPKLIPATGGNPF